MSDLTQTQNASPPEPRAPSPTNTIVAAVAMNNVIYIFDQTGDIYRMQPKPFQIEQLWTGTYPTRAVDGRNTTSNLPQGISSPSYYGGNYPNPPPPPVLQPPYGASATHARQPSENSDV